MKKSVVVSAAIALTVALTVSVGTAAFRQRAVAGEHVYGSSAVLDDIVSDAKQEDAVLSAEKNTAKETANVRQCDEILETVAEAGNTSTENLSDTFSQEIARKGSGIPTSHYTHLNGCDYNIISLKGTIGAFLAVRSTEDLKFLLKEYFAYGVEFLFSAVSSIIPEPPTIQEENHYKDDLFYKGTEHFAEQVSEQSKWRLGYAQDSLIPDDFDTAEYFMAGFLTVPATRAKTVEDDMKVRTIVVDDSTGRGKVAISVIDCIGLSNHDVRLVRQALADYAQKNNIVSINVMSTHNHSGIDTMGLWGNLAKSITYNVLSTKAGSDKSISGVSERYLKLLVDRVSKSVIKADQSMAEGEFYYSKTDISDYMTDKREPRCVIGDMNRLRFVPDDETKTPTMLVNFGIHPNVSGLKTDNGTGDFVTGEYVYYMEEIINSQGYNMLFLQGALGGHIDPERALSSDGQPLATRHGQTVRFGRELGRIACAITMTEKEIESSSLVDLKEIEQEAAQSENYTLWYENWKPAAETRVDPILNIRGAQTLVAIDNPLIQAVAKLRLASNTLVKGNDGSLKTLTEISYMEMGQYKFVMVPGEISPELIIGGESLTAAGSYYRKDFGFPTMNEIADGELIVLGLANDAVGYIIPDNDYVDLIAFDHYEEFLSFGSTFASSLVTQFRNIVDEVKE